MQHTALTRVSAVKGFWHGAGGTRVLLARLQSSLQTALRTRLQTSGLHVNAGGILAPFRTKALERYQRSGISSQNRPQSFQNSSRLKPGISFKGSYGPSLYFRTISTINGKFQLFDRATSASFQYRTAGLSNPDKSRLFSTPLSRDLSNQWRRAFSTSSKPPKLTKEELLQGISNPISRLWIHIKWPLIRNNRPFSVDDFSAFISWLVMGHVLWIILGTTTFGLVVMYSIHTFDNIWNTIKGENPDSSKNVDHSILGYITGSILSHGLGFKIEFSKGSVLPEWRDGMLRFKDFRIHSIPTEAKDDDLMVDKLIEFTANIKAMNVSLSFNKWYEGNGLIYDLEILGMNAKLYKSNATKTVTSVDAPSTSSFNSMALSFSRYNENHDISDHYYKELSTIKKSRQSFVDPNYEFAHIKIQDTYIEVHETSDGEFTNTPFKISVFNCDLPKLRGDRLLVDFFNANNVTGAINESMFTIHKKQLYSDPSSDRVVTFKIDGINMDSIAQNNSQLKFNWIVNGKAEITADIRLPSLNDSEGESDSFSISNEYKKVSGIFSQIFNELMYATKPSAEIPEQTKVPVTTEDTPLLKSAIAAIYQTFNNMKSEPINIEPTSEYVVVSVKVKFHDIKASLPKQLPIASSASIPFISLHDLRSLIAYVNDDKNTSPIIIKTTVIEKLSDLYNTQDLSQTRIFDTIIGDIYEDLLKLVKLDEKRIIEEKSSLWSHSVASQLLLLGLGVIV